MVDNKVLTVLAVLHIDTRLQAPYDLRVMAGNSSNNRLDRIERALEEIAQAHKELAQAHQRTEQVVKQVVHEQRALTRNVGQLQKTVGGLVHEQRALTRSVDQLQKTVGGLVHDRSFSLEAMAAVWLPGYLKSEHGIKTDGFARRYFPAGRKQLDEINLYADGKKGRGRVAILVECKTDIGRKGVRDFIRKSNRVSRMLEVPTFKLMLGYAVHPEANVIANKVGIRLVSPVPHVL